jgi:hypothetical protein
MAHFHSQLYKPMRIMQTCLLPELCLIPTEDLTKLIGSHSYLKMRKINYRDSAP